MSVPTRLEEPRPATSDTAPASSGRSAVTALLLGVAGLGVGIGNVSLWTVTGAGHTEGLAVSPGEWEETVVAFFDSAIDG